MIQSFKALLENEIAYSAILIVVSLLFGVTLTLLIVNYLADKKAKSKEEVVKTFKYSFDKKPSVKEAFEKFFKVFFLYADSMPHKLQAKYFEQTIYDFKKILFGVKEKNAFRLVDLFLTVVTVNQKFSNSVKGLGSALAGGYFSKAAELKLTAHQGDVVIEILLREGISLILRLEAYEALNQRRERIP